MTGDTVYGGSGPLRGWLEARGQAYVLALARNDAVDLSWQRTSYHLPVEAIALHAVPAAQWQRLAAGDGATGPRPRWFDWALGRLVPPQQPGFEQALLIRRPLDAPDDPKALAYYLTFAPSGTLLETLVAVAGRRWTIEESLEAAKGEVARWGWTTTRCAIPTAGTATSPWRCSRSPIWPSCGPACREPRAPTAKGGLHG